MPIKKAVAGLGVLVLLAAPSVQQAHAAPEPARTPAKLDHPARFQPRSTVTRKTVRPSSRLAAKAQSADAHTIKLDVLDRTGKVPTTARARSVYLHPLNGDESIYAPLENGHAEGSVPNGDYAVTVDVATPEQDGELSSTLVYLSRVSVTGDTSLVLDARKGRAVRVAVDRHDARLTDGAVIVSQKLGDKTWTTGLLLGRDLYVTPTGADPEVGYRVQALLTRNGAEMGSPYAYNVAAAAKGIPEDPLLSVRTRDLAAVTTGYSGEGGPGCAARNAGVEWGLDVGVGLYWGVGAVPTSRTEYFTPGLNWSNSETLTTADCGFAEADGFGRTDSFPRPGSYTRRWNAAPLGPAAGFWDLPSHEATYLDVDMLSGSDFDGDSRPGGYFTGSTTLRDAKGTVVATSDTPGSAAFVWPRPALGKYELTVDAHRAAPWSDLATRQRVVWNVDVTSAERITLPSVRYRTSLDPGNRARPGSRQVVTLMPDRPGGLPAGSTPSFWMSSDEGTTWKPVPLLAQGAQWTATFRNPASGHVSFRTAVPGVVDQTVVRAYGIG